MQDLDLRLPYILIRAADGATATVQLSGEPVTVGRLPEYNTIALEPDPDRLVSRVRHCVFESRAGLWWIVPGNGLNPISITRSGRTLTVEDPISLDDGDVLRILALLPTGDDTNISWELEYHDPQHTRPAVSAAVPAFLEYDTVGARLFRITRGVAEEITDLRPQEHQLVRYMDEANAAHGYAAALCSHVDIAEALWGDEAFNHGEAEIARIVWGLRRKIEPDQAEPQLLQTVRGLGYRLVTRPYSGSR